MNWEATGDNTYFRKARKQHRCCGGHDGTKRLHCDKPILPGEHYVEYVGEVPLWQSGYRYHHECACQQGLIRPASTRTNDRG
jgi:hypothetical protein